MSYRAAVLLFDEDRIALIERHKQGLHYFTFPGGHVEAGESPAAAAVRETKEELGLEVRVQKECIRMLWNGKWQHYYLVAVMGGTFGDGQGPEMHHAVPERGTYLPTWLPLCDLLEQPVKPRQVAELVQRCAREGWPPDVVVLTEAQD